jgi:hypothetical protein
MSYNHFENLALAQTAEAITQLHWHPTHVVRVDPNTSEYIGWQNLNDIERFTATQQNVIFKMELHDNANVRHNPKDYPLNPNVTHVKFEVINPQAGGSGNSEVSISEGMGHAQLRFTRQGDYDFKLGDRTIKVTIPLSAVEPPRVEVAAPPQAHTRRPRHGE